jgi:hypothetical protein
MVVSIFLQVSHSQSSCACLSASFLVVSLFMLLYSCLYKGRASSSATSDELETPLHVAAYHGSLLIVVVSLLHEFFLTVKQCFLACTKLFVYIHCTLAGFYSCLFPSCSARIFACVLMCACIRFFFATRPRLGVRPPVGPRVRGPERPSHRR